MVSRDKGIGRGPTHYKIVVRDELGERFAQEFEGMSLQAGGGQTVLIGEIIDQAHLHGFLNRLGDFGLELLSVEALPEREEG